MNPDQTAPNDARRGRVLETFVAFLRLGLSSFGGPVAHLGYFRSEFVARRRWLDDAAYADLVALCQFLPGPASSQVGIGLGLLRAGVPGACVAWLGFTLPSALAMIGLAELLMRAGLGAHPAWWHGLKVVAVAVVAQALWGMGRTLCPDRQRARIAFAAAALALALPGVGGQIGVLLAGGLAGRLWLRAGAALPQQAFAVPLGRRAGVALLVLCAALLAALPLLAATLANGGLALFDAFYRAGALVFGGGHVVLPMLQAEVVPPGWVGNDAFLAGYGAAQALPGPLFSFAGFLGALSTRGPGGWAGGVLALVAIFLPGFLLVTGALPLWERVRRHPSMQRAMQGVNAAVVGLLLAAFYRPVWTGAILAPADFALALIGLLLLMAWKLPPWSVVLVCALLSGVGWH